MRLGVTMLMLAAPLQGRPHEQCADVARPLARACWLEAAEGFHDALGEYAHAHKEFDPFGPCMLLSALQIDAEDDPDAFFTARRHAMDFVSELSARTTIQVIGTVSDKSASAAVDMLDGHVPYELSETAEERMLNHAWGIRNRLSSLRG